MLSITQYDSYSHDHESRRVLISVRIVLALVMVCGSAVADKSRLSSLAVPDGFEVVNAVEPGLTAYPMFMEFDDVGRLYIAESTGKDLSGNEMADAPECQILRLEDTDGDGVFDTRSVFATELGLPQGVLWHQGALFVADPPNLVRFEDKDGDGVSDERTILQSGWKTKHTDGMHGPYLGPDGRLYITQGLHGFAVETNDGAVFEGRAGGVFRSKVDGTGLERVVGGGFNNPVEVAFTDFGQMMGTMTYFTLPEHGQRDAIMHWIWGGVYPRNSGAVHELTRTGRYMPVMSKFARIAPSGILALQSDGLGEEYRGALFSAQFNPHRIQVHTLEPDGSTFRTMDSDFMTSSDDDFYPTDVLEDADGSLLFCDTGAWYVDACPISRVAKPEITGSIYRIYRKGGKSSDDPWGRSLNFAAIDANKLIEHLSDKRFRVRERAFETIVLRGKNMLPSLAQAARFASDAQARRQAVWAMYRIGGDAIADSIRNALNDSALEVRVASIQALGELKDTDSVTALIARLRSESPLERREAATALGRIGDASATDALLEAVTGGIDRFEEHAIRFALIELENRKVLREVLHGHEESSARESALIVLDQLKDASVSANAVKPFLESSSHSAQRTGLWVAQRHPGWSNQILKLVISFLNRGDESSTKQVTDVLKAYAANPNAQRLVAAKLTDETFAHRELLLDVINEAAPAELPEPWVVAIGANLGDGDEGVRDAALNVASQRRISALSGELSVIADDESMRVASRLTALAAIDKPGSTLEGARLELVLNHFQADNDTAGRRASATVLASSTLTIDLKQRLAQEYLPSADALMLTTLMQVFQGETDASLGSRIVDGFAKNEDATDFMTTVQLERLLDSFPDSVHEDARSFLAKLEESNSELTERFLRLEPNVRNGDVGKGRRIFFGKQTACASCHAIGDEGGTIGPDLTTIGLVRSGHDLLEAVFFPSSSMVPDYQTYIVETNDDLLSGIIGGETQDALTIHTGAEESRTLDRRNVIAMDPSPISVMPEGLDSGLSDDDVIDLISFLMSLNNDRFLEPGMKN